MSGRRCVAILCKEFGFTLARKKGSHIILKKELKSGTVGTVVPDHKELKPGTIKGALKLAGVNEKEFFRFM